MDKKQLDTWLRTRPREDAILIAQRAALRVWPVWGACSYLPDFRTRDFSVSVLMRALLTVGISRASITPELAGVISFISRENFFAAQVALKDSRAAAALYSARAATISARFSNPGFATSAALACDYASRAAPPAAMMWEFVNQDAQAIRAGFELLRVPLWYNEQPKYIFRLEQEALEKFSKRVRQKETFWHRWYLSAKSGEWLDWELQKAVALIPSKIWHGSGNDLETEIAQIEDEFNSSQLDESEDFSGMLAAARFFDLIEHNRQLRISGVAIDFDGMAVDDVEKCLRAMRDWTDELQDWSDYAQDHLRSGNTPCLLKSAADKMISMVRDASGASDFPAGRFITKGGDLRRLALDEGERGKVGQTLAGMMDDRLDSLSRLLGACFGHVLARIEPLNALTLGQNDPGELIADASRALDRLKSLDPKDLLPLDPGAAAAYDDMLRDLTEMNAALKEARSPEQTLVLKERFAARYGGFGVTLGHWVDRGRKLAANTGGKLDEAGKWLKRVDTLDAIVEWLRNLGMPF